MLSNTATPKYYAAFREKVESGEIPVGYKILQQMDRIEKKIASPIYYYDPAPVEGFIKFCETEMNLFDNITERTVKCSNKKIYGTLATREIYIGAIIDYISGMSDNYCIRVFNELITY